MKNSSGFRRGTVLFLLLAILALFQNCNSPSSDSSSEGAASTDSSPSPEETPSPSPTSASPSPTPTSVGGPTFGLVYSAQVMTAYSLDALFLNPSNSVPLSTTSLSGFGELAVDPNGTFILGTVSNALMKYPINSSTGALGQGVTLVNSFTNCDPVGVDSTGSYLVCVATNGTATNNSLIVVSLNTNPVKVTNIPLNGSPLWNLSSGGFTVRTNETGSNGLLHPSGKFIYLIGGGAPAGTSGFSASAIFEYGLNLANGTVTAPTLTAQYLTSANQLAYIFSSDPAMDPSGKFLVMPTFEALITYQVNQTTGALTQISGAPAPDTCFEDITSAISSLGWIFTQCNFSTPFSNSQRTINLTTGSLGATASPIFSSSTGNYYMVSTVSGGSEDFGAIVTPSQVSFFQVTATGVNPSMVEISADDFQFVPAPPNVFLVHSH